VGFISLAFDVLKFGELSHLLRKKEKKKSLLPDVFDVAM
jgi:hypothetical protein